jgi:iron(III) transport system ATP-binding protein
MTETHIQIQSISKKFGKTTALDDINLEIRSGEFIFLLGPSGCGKTTLLRIIAGLEEPTGGKIVQGGLDVTRLPPSKRNIGIVFQSYALFPNLTVFQNIAYGLENRRESRQSIANRVDEMLALVGLDEYGDRYPTQLSGGQQQRVALARALAISPKVLLLDEPLSALDARVRANLRIEIAQLQRRLGVTTIMVSHDQEEALTMADRVVVMEKGKMVQLGEPEQIYHQPATPFVADFVGLMNFIPGKVAPGQDSRVEVGGLPLLLDQSILHAPGEPITLAIRPESVEIAQDWQAANVLRAKVYEVEFMGPFYRLHLLLHQGNKLIAYMPPENARGKTIREGMELPVRLPPSQLRIFTQAESSVVP